jgi:hypothetical protein
MTRLIPAEEMMVLPVWLSGLANSAPVADTGTASMSTVTPAHVAALDADAAV